MSPLNQKTIDAVNAALETNHHALAIIGDPLIGLSSLCQHVREQIEIQPGNEYTILPEKTSITIEQIKALKQQLRTTHPNGMRLIVINEAGLMSVEAQNALLKLLEEPGRQTLFILGVVRGNSVLRTILSRCQPIQLVQPSEAVIAQYVKDLDFGVITHAQAIMMCRGRPGYLQLLSSDEAFATSQLSVFKDAKYFLQSDSFGKLAMAKQYKERAKAIELLAALLALLDFQIQRTGVVVGSANLVRKIESIEVALIANAAVLPQLQKLCV